MPRAPFCSTLALAMGIALVAACTTSNSKSQPRAEKDGAEPFTPCKSDHECMLSCIAADDCCGTPCGCENARHGEDHEKISQQRDCKGFDYTTCPTVSCSEPEYAVVPKCSLGRCVAERVPREEPDVVDLSEYDRSCNHDADCILVDSDPCGKCGCASEAISASQGERFQKASQAIKCPPYDPHPDIQCGSCMEYEPHCNDNQCTARPAP